ncbi:hypothetical protein [Legionella donaldsonii]|nr:hypothetical protein [Legionella donaldsonii]
MDYQKLKDDLKSDLHTISTLEMDIVPAKDYYGALLSAVLKSSFFMLAVNVVVQLWFKLVGSYRVDLSLSLLIKTWFLTLAFSLIPVFFIRSFILFDKLIQCRLKSEDFVREKIFLLVKIYFLIFSISYAGISYMSSVHGGLEFFDILFTQFGACIFSLVITGLLAGIESERLGFGMLIELVSAFGEKMQKATLFSSEER